MCWSFVKTTGRIQQLSFCARQNNTSHIVKYIHQQQIKGVKTDAACNGMGKNGNIHNILVDKGKGGKPLRRSKVDENNIKKSIK
jgi:hypothetical protein